MTKSEFCPWVMAILAAIFDFQKAKKANFHLDTIYYPKMQECILPNIVKFPTCPTGLTEFLLSWQGTLYLPCEDGVMELFLRSLRGIMTINLWWGYKLCPCIGLRLVITLPGTHNWRCHVTWKPHTTNYSWFRIRGIYRLYAWAEFIVLLTH